MNFRRKHLSGYTLLALIAMTTPALSHAIELKDAVMQTVKDNPEIGMKWYTFRASAEEKGIARADFFPTVDLSYTVGHENLKDPQSKNVATESSFTRHGYAATLNQNLFTGFQTINQLKQLDYTARARYFEYLAAAESQSLESVRAFIDVVRYSKLVEIAEENYAVHKGIYEQILQRVSQGVGRRVDLEQINGRLSLAESNLINEMSNLHDVKARYARIMGEEPPAELTLPALDLNLVPSNADLMPLADKSNPSLLAARSFYRASEHDINVRKGAFSPKVDLRATHVNTENYQATDNNYRDTAVELVVSMNLFRGGADRARLLAATERKGEAEAMGIKACRDMRQQVSIAHNDVLKITSQLDALRQHALSTEKARDAYRSQFDIGQRTLLDLLDSENELFDARREQINGELNQQLAIYRVLGESGRLLEALQIQPQDSSLSRADDLTYPTCPTDYTAPMAFDKDKVAARNMTAPIVAKTTPAPIVRDVTVRVQVQFDLDSAKLRPESIPALDQLVTTLNMPELANKTFRVEGHTDTTGGFNHNLDLSKRRAQAVRDYLQSKGIAASRLSSEGYGSTRLLPNLAPTDPTHRRVVVVIQDNSAPAAPLPVKKPVKRLKKPAAPTN
ncbi:TolC family outer membrane protein [Vogesella oryzae]|uniref:TolC family outer membrane protein n=1 Tax=Vogesella oryzae TaxID=1735285 RepID=UPI001C2E1C5E|nr:TolC family outer membrane protein [Vogesella oryzae]